MQTLYLITGPAGVGKSTISKKLANFLDNSVLIEGDDIYHHVISGYVSPWKEGNHLDTFWKAIFSLIDVYLNDGYNVVFNYIINFEYIKKFKEMFKNFDIKFVVLMTDEKTLLARDAKRPEDCQMKERCITLLNGFKNKNYPSKYILDTSSLSMEEALQEVLNNSSFSI